jgi:hypothetical protein
LARSCSLRPEPGLETLRLQPLRLTALGFPSFNLEPVRLDTFRALALPLDPLRLLGGSPSLGLQQLGLICRSLLGRETFRGGTFGCDQFCFATLGIEPRVFPPR